MLGACAWPIDQTYRQATLQTTEPSTPNRIPTCREGVGDGLISPPFSTALQNVSASDDMGRVLAGGNDLVQQVTLLSRTHLKNP